MPGPEEVSQNGGMFGKEGDMDAEEGLPSSYYDVPVVEIEGGVVLERLLFRLFRREPHAFCAARIRFRHIPAEETNTFWRVRRGGWRVGTSTRGAARW